MSRENLPTNYVNYELATAMGGMRRFNQINNSDGTISFEDATTYSTTGTTYGASEINTANALINEINELVGVTSISGSGQTDITSLLGGTDITESTLGIGDGTVTGAISELNSNLTDHTNQLSKLSGLFKLVSYSKSYTLAAYGATEFENMASVPSGYECFCYYSIDTGNVWVAARMMKANDIYLHNTSSSSQSGTLSGKIICIRNTGYLS